MHNSRGSNSCRTKRLVVRAADRRRLQMQFEGRDRRRRNYDRRKLTEPQALKPPMSDAAYQPLHAPAYVAGVAAELGRHRRASGVEASAKYSAVARRRQEALLRGLTVDSEIK